MTNGTELANASPEKRLFISLLTRDISLIDAILDLIDNSINSAIISRRVRLESSMDYMSLFETRSDHDLIPIEINFNNHRFEIKDAAGGIRFSVAKEEVFKFGREATAKAADEDRLSVYGIGLKRAILKRGFSPLFRRADISRLATR